MHALRFERTGSLDGLHYAELPTPPLAAEELRVEVRAAGLNPSDVKNILGRFPYTTLPRTPGRDFAGVVVEGDAGWVGKEVWGTGKELGFTRDGSHASHLVVPSGGVSLKPHALSFAQAASCGVPFTTAWDALERAGVKAGTRFVLVGAGAVGRAALALASARRAEVLVLVRRDDQAAALQKEGVRAAVLRPDSTVATAVKAVFSEGAEAIFDTTGAWLPECVPALGHFGRLAVIAAPADGHARLPVLELYRRGGSIVGVNSLLYATHQCAPVLTLIGRLFDEGALPPPTGVRAVPLAEGVQAYRDVDRGSADKVVLAPAELQIFSGS